jgi:hypothetical protein
MSLFIGVRGETVRKAPIGAELGPQKPTKRVHEALFRCWRPTKWELQMPLQPLFGQSRKRSSRKSISRILHSPGPIGGCRASHDVVRIEVITTSYGADRYSLRCIHRKFTAPV